jgi:signal-transduction protein with cAMP-binding, CBS, and nucleotidyltransferase domain
VTEDYNDVCAVIRELEEAQKREDTEKKITKRLREKIRKHIAVLTKKKNTPDTLTAEYVYDLKEKYDPEGYEKKVQIYPKGTVICREGHTVHCMYDIYWGRVGVYTGYGTDHEELITELYPDTYFGEAGMVSDEPRSATVVALEDTTVEIIYREDLEELLRKNPYKIQQIMQHLTFRLRRLSDAYLQACEQASRMAGEQGE